MISISAKVKHYFMHYTLAGSSSLSTLKRKS